MARLRQLHPSNYGFQGNTSNEFENVIRYLNAAELGNLTIAELLRKLFDDEGNFDGPIEFRVNNSTGLEYRIGDYVLNGVDQPEEGWTLLISLEDLRGMPGVSFGNVFAPVWSTRIDVTAEAGQTEIEVSLDENTETIVYLNGVLQREGESDDYTHQTTTTPTQIVFNSALSLDDEVSIFRVTPPNTDGYTRIDWDVLTDRFSFSFEFDDNENPLVYHNGILQRKGPTADYTLDYGSRQIIFNEIIPAGDDVSAILIENEAQDVVAGLMLEGTYVDGTTGMILGSKVQYADEEFPQAKVAGLVDAVSAMASAKVSSTQPDPETLFWLDTSGSPAVMKYWDGAQYLPTAGSTGLPTFTVTDANRFIKINGTGTGFEYGSVDLSGLIPVSQRGAANGVATLDASGRLTQSQMPSPRNRRVIWQYFDGAITDGDYDISRLYLEKSRVLGFVGVLSSGTATAEIKANGVSVSTTFALSSSLTEAVIGSPVSLDASSTSIKLQVEIASASSANGLEVGIVVETTE